MDIKGKVVDLLVRRVVSGVIDGIAPVLTVSVDNAIRRHSTTQTRKEVLPLLLAAGDFCKKLSDAHGEISEAGPGVSYVFDMELLTSFRKLQQAAEAYNRTVYDND